MRPILCLICLLLIGGCQSTETSTQKSSQTSSQGRLVTLEGYIVVHKPTILLFATREEREEEVWNTCHNIAVRPNLIGKARRLSNHKVRIVAEDIGWPIDEGMYDYTVYDGQRLVRWCLLQPFYMAKKIEVARGR